MRAPKRGARSASLEDRAKRAFEEYFGVPFEERFRASLADAREWTESVAALHKRASVAMEQARSVAREARALAKEAASLSYDGMGPIDQASRLWTQWLSVVPDYDGAISLAEWLRRSTTFGALARTPWPTTPWGLWREALDKWWRREKLFPIGDDAPPRLHLALQHLAGFAEAQQKGGETAEEATQRITKLIRDWRRYEADRRGDYAEELSSAIGAVWSESIDPEKPPGGFPV